MPSLEAALSLVPEELMGRSGKVAYAGRDAFTAPCRLYILGLNPGGKPRPYGKDSVRGHNAWVLNEAPSSWSAYRDESWSGRAPGTSKMQPRILHLLRRLELDPGEVPASNLVFLRSTRGDKLGSEFDRLADLCWPFHDYVLRELQPKVLLCLGGKAGKYARARLGAHVQTGQFVERNNRRWKSTSFSTPSGPSVVVATHPGIADWTTTATDPTELVVSALRA